MSSTTFYACDFDGCFRVLDDVEVAQIHLCVHPSGDGNVDSAQRTEGYGLDLCDEHLALVMERILTSTSV